jgi:hypothetical protein
MVGPDLQALVVVDPVFVDSRRAEGNSPDSCEIEKKVGLA